ncbi:MAG: sulfatase [Lentisphaerae bacterium RIFOXYA12_FULL_48_11]|nr:MAG: sulfatase [Lentisphaerae bacterium RIFOXYA12_FULL_48_11]
MNRRDFIKAGASLISVAALPGFLKAADGKLPNILWIVAEDMNPNLGCYGDPDAVTPNLDKFARESLRYLNCWSTAPVCAPARTTLITGVYPTSTGAEHMRSLVKMPGFMKMYPQLLREAGYYCTNCAKEDYNLEKPGEVWDVSSKKGHWKNRPAGKPFMAVFNIEKTHESQIRKRPHTLVHDPLKIRVPAYHPDTPEVRHDWAQYHDNVTVMDEIAGNYLKELETAGLAEDTIVFFYGDNGGGMPRGKRWCYKSGLNVPLIIRIPEKYQHLAPRDYTPGGSTDRPVGFVDFAPTLYSLAGIKPPDWVQGHAFMGKLDEPQKYIHGFRGRMDERYDLVRSVRNDRYLYVHNYMPHMIYGQHIAYMFQTPTTAVWKKMYDEGKLKPPQTFFWETKPPEELYDIQADPDEVKNLVDSPDHKVVLNELRKVQRDHVLKIRDVGFLPESEMIRRSNGSTPYEMGHDPKEYPIAKILEMAEFASSLRPDVVSELKDGLKNSDCAVRYWAVLGFVMRGTVVVNSGNAELRELLKDESPAVRIAVARALGLYGSDEDRKMVLAVLKELVSPDKNGIYVAMDALNVVDAMGDRANGLKDFLRTIPRKDPAATSRITGFAKLLEKVLQ